MADISLDCEDSGATSTTRDFLHGGAGYIPVFVGIDATPDVPLRRKVIASRAIDNLSIRLIWTEEDGTGTIEDLNPAYKYNVQAFDYTGVYAIAGANDVEVTL